MSTKAALQEMIDSLEAENMSLENELTSIKEKAIRSTNDYKAKLKAAAKEAHEQRQAGYNDSVEANDNIKKAARQLYTQLQRIDKTGVGVCESISINDRMVLLRNLFGGL